MAARSEQKLRPKEQGESLPHYKSVVKRWQVYSTLDPGKQAAYIVDSAFVNDPTLQQRADRVWEVHEQDLLKENGVAVLFEKLMADEEGLRLIDLALQWVVFHQVIGPGAKMARTASESVSEYLDRISHEAAKLQKSSAALAPSDISSVLVALIGMQATPNDYTVIQNNFDFKALISSKNGYTHGDGWAKFQKSVKGHIAPKVLHPSFGQAAFAEHGSISGLAGVETYDPVALFTDMLDETIEDETLGGSYLAELVVQDVIDVADEDEQPADPAAFVAFYNRHRASFLKSMRERGWWRQQKGYGKRYGKKGGRHEQGDKGWGRHAHKDSQKGQKGSREYTHGKSKGSGKRDGKSSAPRQWAYTSFHGETCECQECWHDWAS